MYGLSATYVKCEPGIGAEADMYVCCGYNCFNLRTLRLGKYKDETVVSALEGTLKLRAKA